MWVPEKGLGRMVGWRNWIEYASPAVLRTHFSEIVASQLLRDVTLPPKRDEGTGRSLLIVSLSLMKKSKVYSPTAGGELDD